MRVHPGEARKGKRKAIGCLQIACRECKADIGKCCWFPKGTYGFAHDARRQDWERMKREAKHAT
jgi:hypothetical protein